MKNTKTNKILITILCFAMIVAMSASVFAGDIFNQLDGNSNVETNGITTIGNSVISVLRVVGIVVSIIVLMIIGIKYMMGSAEEKSEYKKTFMPYIIGALIVFAASVFAKTLYTWISGIKL